MSRARVLKRKPSSHLALCLTTAEHNTALALPEFRLNLVPFPYMQVYITHGFFDLVTPYFASNHLADLMKLNPEIRPNLTLRHFQGGHMFYTWDESRQQWFAEMKAFYQDTTA